MTLVSLDEIKKKQWQSAKDKDLLIWGKLYQKELILEAFSLEIRFLTAFRQYNKLSVDEVQELISSNKLYFSAALIIHKGKSINIMVCNVKV